MMSHIGLCSAVLKPRVWILAVAILDFWSQKWPYLEKGDAELVDYQNQSQKALLPIHTYKEFSLVFFGAKT